MSLELNSKLVAEARIPPKHVAPNAPHVAGIDKALELGEALEPMADPWSAILTVFPLHQTLALERVARQALGPKSRPPLVNNSVQLQRSGQASGWSWFCRGFLPLRVHQVIVLCRDAVSVSAMTAKRRDFKSGRPLETP